jgi:hypothetical protein
MPAPQSFLRERTDSCALDAVVCWPAEDPDAVSLGWLGTTWSFLVFAVFAALVVLGTMTNFFASRVCTTQCRCLRLSNGGDGTDSAAAMAAFGVSLAVFAAMMLCARDTTRASPAAVVSALVCVVTGCSAALFVVVARCLVLSHSPSWFRGDVWVDMTNVVALPWGVRQLPPPPPQQQRQPAAAPTATLNQAENAVGGMGVAILLCGVLAGGGLGCGWADAVWPGWPLVPRVIVYSVVMVLTVAFATSLQEVSE